MVYMLKNKIMERIFNYIASIRKDLILHFIVGLLITQVTGDIVYLLTHSFYGGVIASLTCGFGAGIIKEIYDCYHITYTKDIKELVATISGSLVGLILIIIVLI